jgi:glycosyltransferase involved in cell wall biosynthesis
MPPADGGLMRLVVLNLTSGGLSGGYRKYLRRLMPLLGADRRVSALTIFVPAGGETVMDPGLDVRAFEPGPRVVPRLVRRVAELRPDVVFVPTARAITFGTIPVVTMVRNMEPLTVPFGENTWRESMKNVLRAREAKRACRGAHRVIAVSNHVRAFLISRWRLEPGRVGLVYHGADPIGPGAPERGLLFTAGSIRPARGLEDAITALPLLGAGVRLMIGGAIDAGAERYGRRLRALAQRLAVADRVEWTGQLAPAAMADAFRRAETFVMTSRAEACPNTALEAMSHGAASVSVETPPMPEFFGDAALYYPAGDAPALARGLQRLRESPAEMLRLRAAALRRVAAFSWEATRDRTLEELRRACG